MLALSRYRQQSIMIGNDVRVTVLEIRGDKVRLAFDAPASVAIHRKEVYDAMKSRDRQVVDSPVDESSAVDGPQG